MIRTCFTIVVFLDVELHFVLNNLNFSATWFIVQQMKWLQGKTFLLQIKQHFQARKTSLTKRLHSTQDEDSVCYKLQEVHNDKVELHYDISTLNLLGLIETPEDQIIRDEGNIKI